MAGLSLRLTLVLLLGALGYVIAVSSPFTNSNKAIVIPEAPQASQDVKCIICGLLINEIEGMLTENLTESEIEKYLRDNTCSILPAPVKLACDEIVDLIPEILDSLDKKVPPSTVCVNHNYCKVPFTDLPDPQPVPTYVINLDLPPRQRLAKICAVPQFKAAMTTLVDALGELFDNMTFPTTLGQLINNFYFPSEYAQEIQGCADVMGIDYGWLTWVNLGYEVSEACTSIVAQTKSGKIYHVRNMDFWDGVWLTNHLKNLTITAEYQKGGKTVFYATTFAGYVGVLSGMKPGAFSISINTRYYPTHGLKNFLYEIVAAVMETNNSLVSFLSRNVFMHENDWPAAVKQLSTGALIADVYYTVGGVSAYQGAVISRNRTAPDNVWTLNSTHWYELQTNYDHWKQPPWFDDRVVPGDDAMNAMGQNNVDLPNLLKVLSVKPVLNIQSTFTMLTSAADGTYTSYTRWCQYPCVE